MRPNKIQSYILILGGIALLTLLLFPPWQEAAEKEASYRKDIGRGPLWSPPAPMAVDCYFVGCVTAPASYFHALVNRKLLLQQCLTVFGVGVVLLWMFRSRGNNTATFLGRKRILLTSFVLAMLIPPTGDVPFGAVLFGIPNAVIQKDEFWLIPTIMAVGLYSGCVLLVYLVLTRLIKRFETRSL